MLQLCNQVVNKICMYVYMDGTAHGFGPHGKQVVTWPLIRIFPSANSYKSGYLTRCLLTEFIS
jgi:hypothetical protein